MVSAQEKGLSSLKLDLLQSQRDHHPLPAATGLGLPEAPLSRPTQVPSNVAFRCLDLFPVSFQMCPSSIFKEYTKHQENPESEALSPWSLILPAIGTQSSET